MLKKIKQRKYILKNNRHKYLCYKFLCIITLIFAILLPGITWIFSSIEDRGITVMRGDSMLPTLSADDICYVDDLNFERGDIVVATFPISEKYPSTSGLAVVKRIIGLPGEVVRIEEDGIYINDVLLEEPYCVQLDSLDERNTYKEILLSDNDYFLVGDNRKDSFDSRAIGGIPKENFLYGISTSPNNYTTTIIVNLIVFELICICAAIIINYLWLYIFTPRIY